MWQAPGQFVWLTPQEKKIHTNNDRKLCETYLIDIDEPFFEPKWKYAPFRTYSEYGKVKPKKVKRPIFVDFDLVSEIVRRMCSDYTGRHSHITY